MWESRGFGGLVVWLMGTALIGAMGCDEAPTPTIDAASTAPSMCREEGIRAALSCGSRAAPIPAGGGRMECARVGPTPADPSADWPDVEGDGGVIWVRPDATGDGASPTNALGAIPTPVDGGVVALSRGVHLVPPSLTFHGDARLVGVGAGDTVTAGTTLVGSVAAQELSVVGVGRVTLSGLRVEGLRVLRVANAGAALELADVALRGVETVAEHRATLEAQRVRWETGGRAMLHLVVSDAADARLDACEFGGSPAEAALEEGGILAVNAHLALRGCFLHDLRGGAVSTITTGTELAPPCSGDVDVPAGGRYLEIERTALVGNGRMAVAGRGKVCVLARSVHISETRRVGGVGGEGFHLTEGATLLLDAPSSSAVGCGEENVLRANQGAGVAVQNAGTVATVRYTTLEANGGGAMIGADAVGRFEHNRLRGNQYVGIGAAFAREAFGACNGISETVPGIAVAVGSIIQAPSGYGDGISVLAGDGGVTMRGNTLSRNARFGLVVAAESAQLEANQGEANGYQGVRFQGGEARAIPTVGGDAGAPDGAPILDAAIAPLCATGTFCGVCVNPASDPRHCGGCGNACPPGRTCASGVCTCGGGGSVRACGGACVDTASDPRHCGACSMACGVSQTCVMGRCADCPATSTICGDVCVSTASDPRHCGGCGRACAGGQVCFTGQCRNQCLGATCRADEHCDLMARACVCNSPLLVCEEFGSCIDPLTNPTHCGGCNRSCVDGEVCRGGLCAPATPSNDRAGQATVIPLVSGALDLRVNTAQATRDITGVPATCTTTTGPDVFYAFTIPIGRSEIVYADTTGSAFAASLYLRRADGVPVAASNLPMGGRVCGSVPLLGCSGGAQILARLDAGTYQIVLAGNGAGRASLHFEHVPVGNTTPRWLAARTGPVTLATSGAGRLRQSCGGTGPEDTFYWYTCAGARGGAFSASTCDGPIGAAFDTVLAQISPQRGGTPACDDNGCGARLSRLTANIPSGRGLHALYVDGFGGGSGSYGLVASRPP